MPLLDHFHPPLRSRHSWEGFHAAWSSSISDHLNRHLPDGLIAEEMTHAGPHYEIDVATFGDDAPPLGGPADPRIADAIADTGGGVALAEPVVWAPPTPVTVPVAFADDFEIRVLSNRGGEARRLVAAVELVGPGNKDRPENRRAFAAKVASYLHYGVAVIVIDVVTERTGNLHHDSLALFAPSDAPRLADDVWLYAAAYRPIRRSSRGEVDYWAHPLALGAPYRRCLST